MQSSLLGPCAAHVASAHESLRRLEEELEANADEPEAVLRQLLTATLQLRDAFEVIDALSDGVSHAAALVEATERRLQVLERGDSLPPTLANLPPAIFSASQFARQVRRREPPELPQLPELSMLPPSPSHARAHARPSGSPSVPSVDHLLENAADEVHRLARTATSRAATALDSMRSLLGRLQ